MIFGCIVRQQSWHSKTGFGWPPLLLACTPLYAVADSKGGNADTGAKQDMGVCLIQSFQSLRLPRPAPIELRPTPNWCGTHGDKREGQGFTSIRGLYQLIRYRPFLIDSAAGGHSTSAALSAFRLHLRLCSGLRLIQCRLLRLRSGQALVLWTTGGR